MEVGHNKLVSKFYVFPLAVGEIKLNLQAWKGYPIGCSFYLGRQSSSGLLLNL